MKPRKKNSFFTFVFSFIPGAAEMYMGFMKSGLSLLVAFITPFLITGMIYGVDYIALLSGIVYAVSFFHAVNIASAPDEEFSKIEDKFIWEEFLNMKLSDLSASYRKWFAGALIMVGVCGVWGLVRENLFKILNTMSEQYAQIIKSIVNSVPRLILSVLIIVLGIMMIRGKKKELTEGEDNGAVDK